MRRNSTLLLLFSAFLLLAVSACQTGKEEKQETTNEQESHDHFFDTYVIYETVGKGNMYNLAYYAGARMLLDSIEVTGPQETLLAQLPNTVRGQHAMLYEPVNAINSNEKPVSGTYTVTLKCKEGVQMQLQDELKIPDNLPYAEVAISHDRENKEMSINWESFAHADLFDVVVTRPGEKEVVMKKTGSYKDADQDMQQTIDYTNKSECFNSNDLLPGDTLSVKVFSIQLEENEEKPNKEVAHLARHTIIW